MEGGGFAPNMMASEGLPNMVGNVFPPITPTLLPNDVLPNLTPTLLPRDVLPTITPVIVPTRIVPELLTEGNYANWRTCIQWYLMGQDLLEVCRIKDIPDKERHPEEFSVWEKKNAMALHAIQISCSREMLSQIRDKMLASEAWDFLMQLSYPIIDFVTEEQADAPAPAGKVFFLFLMLKIVMPFYIINLDNIYVYKWHTYGENFGQDWVEIR